MGYFQSDFKNIEKNVRQELRSRMQKKMDAAAEKTLSHASDYRDYSDVTGNLYKSTAIGTYYNGTVESIHYAPGPAPTRRTLAKGEAYNLDKYYGSSFSFRDSGRKPFVGKYGHGGESAERAANDALFENEHGRGRYHMTWQMLLVAGVDYAKFVEEKRGHDVITSLKAYMARYFKKM